MSLAGFLIPIHRPKNLLALLNSACIEDFSGTSRSVKHTMLRFQLYNSQFASSQCTIWHARTKETMLFLVGCQFALWVFLLWQILPNGFASWHLVEHEHGMSCARGPCAHRSACKECAVPNYDQGRGCFVDACFQ